MANGLAKHANASPEKLGRSVIRDVLKRGHLSKDEQQRDGEVALLMQYLLSRNTNNPEHPGRIGDYVEAWDFDLDIHGDAKAAGINIKKAHPQAAGTV